MSIPTDPSSEPLFANPLLESKDLDELKAAKSKQPEKPGQNKVAASVQESLHPAKAQGTLIGKVSAQPPASKQETTAKTTLSFWQRFVNLFTRNKELRAEVDSLFTPTVTPPNEFLTKLAELAKNETAIPLIAAKILNQIGTGAEAGGAIPEAVTDILQTLDQDQSLKLSQALIKKARSIKDNDPKSTNASFFANQFAQEYHAKYAVRKPPASEPAPSHLQEEPAIQEEAAPIEAQVIKQEEPTYAGVNPEESREFLKLAKQYNSIPSIINKLMEREAPLPPEMANDILQLLGPVQARQLVEELSKKPQTANRATIEKAFKIASVFVNEYQKLNLPAQIEEIFELNNKNWIDQLAELTQSNPAAIPLIAAKLLEFKNLTSEIAINLLKQLGPEQGLALVQELITKETAEASDTGSFLRANSKASVFMTQYQLMLVGDSLKAEITKIQKTLPDTPLVHISPLKHVDNKSIKLTETLSTLLAFTEKLKNISTKLPPEVQKLHQFCQQRALAQFPHNPDFSKMFASQPFILRVLCPLLVKTETSTPLQPTTQTEKLTPAQLAEKTKKENAVVVGKIFLNIANNITTNSKEKWQNPVYEALYGKPGQPPEPAGVSILANFQALKQNVVGQPMPPG